MNNSGKPPAVQPLQVSAEQLAANLYEVYEDHDPIVDWNDLADFQRQDWINVAKAALAATPPQPPSVEIDAFLQEHRDVLQLLFDNDISIGKAIEALRELQEGKVPLLPQVREAEAEAAPPLVGPQRWIPTSERMPEPMANVLLAIPTKRVKDVAFQGEYHYEVGWLVLADPHDCDGEDIFCTEANDYEIENVTHWQPLPAPPGA